MLLLALFPVLAGVLLPVQDVTETDVRFVVEAVQENMAEADLGRLAAELSERDDVRIFGRRMAHEHRQANERLIALARALGIDPPTAVGEEYSELRNRLIALRGPAFDEAYLDSQIAMHLRAIVLYRRQAQTGEIGALRRYAMNYVPVLEGHLRYARSLTAAVPGGPG